MPAGCKKGKAHTLATNGLSPLSREDQNCFHRLVLPIFHDNEK